MHWLIWYQPAQIDTSQFTRDYQDERSESSEHMRKSKFAGCGKGTGDESAGIARVHEARTD